MNSFIYFLVIPVKTEGATDELATELLVVLVVAPVVVGIKTVAFGVVFVEANTVLFWLVRLGPEIATHHHDFSLNIKTILPMKIN